MRIFKVLPVLAVLLGGSPAWAAPPNVEVAQVEVAQAPARDNSVELARLKPLADKGDAAAQYNVGVLYAESRNLFEAARYYRLAADQNHHEAQFRLASLNCNGLGVPKNPGECIRLYRLGADAGVTKAQVNLAARYLMGDGTSADHSAAARLAKLAADKGDSTGQFLLAMCYELGAGVPKDGGEAQRLYKLSAGQGNASAQKALQRLSGQAAPAQRTVSVSSLAVALRRQGGVLMVPAVLNETVTANFVVDSGASDVVIPENVVQALRKAGKLTDADFTGNQMVKLADGSIVKSRTFVLRSFAVNNRVLENIRASVAPGGAMPLLGQSFLQRFSSWSIDNEHQVLLLREKQ
jgi:clan AA aspartic protease (TIGR02281 family)